jgi:hypothetical protein
MENYFSLIWPNVVENIHFIIGTDFKNVHLTLVKIAPKKVFPKNKGFFGIRQIFYW